MVENMRLTPLYTALVILCTATIVACGQSSSSDTAQNSSNNSKPTTTTTAAKDAEVPTIWPEDDSTKTGTSVLGFKLGDSTYQSVTHRLSAWDELGTNSYSDGKMIATNGNGYGIDDLQKVTYIFSPSDQLEAILIQIDNRNAKMNNEGFKKFKGYVAKNGYKQISNKEPFVGDQYAEFKTPTGNIIEIDAPHLSFDLYINYQTANFIQHYKEKSQQTKTEKTNNESAQF